MEKNTRQIFKHSSGIDDVEDKVKSDRLVEEIEEGLEMTAEHIPFGKYKPSKMYNGKKMSLSVTRNCVVAYLAMN